MRSHDWPQKARSCGAGILFLTPSNGRLCMHARPMPLTVIIEHIPSRWVCRSTDLRTILRPELPVAELFDAFVEDLCARDFVRVGAAIRRATHRPALSAQLQAAGAKLRSILAAKPFDPPSRKELAPDPISQQTLRFLIATGEAVEINAELVMDAESVRRATELIRQFIREHGPATVSELRQALGSSRRVIVPLLERLDRDGVTLRREDRRVLRQ